MTHKLLIVDDELPNLRLLERLFAKDFQVLTAPSGPEAIRLLEQHDVAILITDQRMPEMTGIELLKRTARLRPHMVRILLTGYTDLEALVEAINSGLVYMYITKPWNNEDLKVRVSRACEHYQHNKNRSALEDRNKRLLLRLNEVKLGVVGALTEMLRVRDNHAADHALRVRNYAVLIGTKLGISQEQEEDLSLAALLHDLGRIDAYRNRAMNSRKSPVDQTLIQGYSECEARLLHAVPELANVAEIVTSLRENYDGTGTPRGLKAEQIPLSSRILRLVDEYDQMIVPEASASLTHEEAMRFLTQRSGKQFDPMVVEVLTQFSPEDLGESLDSIPTYGEHSRLRQDSYDPAFVDSVL